MEENSFIKVYRIRHGFEVGRDSLEIKPDSCFWSVRKAKKRIKANLQLNL